jgi:hypothetical protein
MKLNLVIAAALLVVTPAFAQGQMNGPAPKAGGQMNGPPPKAAKPTKAQVQKVVQTIGADKTKLDSYCKLSKLQQQMGSLDEKKDAKKLQDLGTQADAEAQKLGPDFDNMMAGLDQVDEKSAEGKDFAALLDGLDAKCK